MPADRDYLQEERADESEYGSLVGGPDAGHPESVDEAPGSWCSSGEVRRRVLTLLLAVLLFFRWRAAAPPQSKFAQCHSIGPVLVGSHHKTGTVLLTHLLKDACDAMDWRCVFNHDRGHCASVAEARALDADICLLQHGVQFKGLVPSAGSSRTPPAVLAAARPRAAGVNGSVEAQPRRRALGAGGGSSGGGTEVSFDPNYRFVHAVRDPLEVVLSGYLYHLRTTERWANRPESRWNGTTYRAYLNALSLEEGLRAEVRHSARDNLKTMPRLFDRTARRPCTLTLRFEDFATDWEATLGSLWDLLGVTRPAELALLARVSEKHNVYRHNNTRGSHVSSTSTDRRAAMRELIRRSPDAIARIRSVRRKLGYPLVGLEGTG